MAYISKQLSRSFYAVKNYIKRKKPYSCSGGRKPKLNERTKRRIMREMFKNETMTAQNTVKTLDIYVSYKTIIRFLHDEAYNL